MTPPEWADSEPIWSPAGSAGGVTDWSGLSPSAGDGDFPGADHSMVSLPEEEPEPEPGDGPEPDPEPVCHEEWLSWGMRPGLYGLCFGDEPAED